ncbi:MAG: Glucokinase [Friedmanniella sp.]|nr:Glucokinase [Friedmanniella sp.]
MAALSSGASVGDVFGLIASGEARTRAALTARTGLSRSTVAERLDVLFRAELIQEGQDARSTGGRPSKTLTLNTERHFILAADVGEDHIRLVVTDLDSRVLHEEVGEVAVGDGPQPAVGWLVDTGRRLVAELGRDLGDLVGVALSVPAPVDFVRGEVAFPSVMTGWEGVSVESLVRESFDVPVVVENDVNARGYGEYLASWRSADDLFYVKAGTGIGSAIISGGSLFRGSRGAAGDIGHIRIDPETGPLCRCGAIGCVEALAAGWSLVRDLRGLGFVVADTREAMAMVSANVPEAVGLLRQAGRTLGRAIAYSVNLLNPDLVVVGGSLSAAGDHLLVGIRESVYQYSLPLATADLAIVAGRGDERSGAIGAAHLVMIRALQADRINSHLRSIA